MRAVTGTQLVEIGRELIEQKEALGHGNFLPWIESEFAMSEYTARRMMNVAEALNPKSGTVPDLPATILYQLAAPSTPEALREEFIREAQEQGGASPGMVAKLRALRCM